MHFKILNAKHSRSLNHSKYNKKSDLCIILKSSVKNLLIKKPLNFIMVLKMSFQKSLVSQKAFLNGQLWQ